MIAEPVARRALRQLRELLAVHRDMETAGILAVPFKGPVLAAQLYGDVARRQSNDLDFLVRRSDLGRATDLLVARGYRPPPLLATRRGAKFLDGVGHHRFTRGDGAIVELHWDFAPRHFPYPIDRARVRSHLEPVRIGGRLLYTVPRDELLFLLCAHGAKHAWVRLAWIRDVAQLVRVASNPDWNAVLAAARRRRALRMMLLSLLLAAELCDAPVPHWVIERARSDPTVSSLAQEVRDRLRIDPQLEPTAAKVRWFQFRTRDRWRDQLRVYAVPALMVGPGDWEWVRLPDRLYALYYLLRPIRLVLKYANKPPRGRKDAQ